MELKPSNIPSIQIWNSWIRSKTTATFKEISNKYRALRRNQIPHTTSRKGMIGLAHEMKQKSNDPKKVNRSKVWIAGHTHADGRPVKHQFAETIEQIQSLDSQMDSTSAGDNIREDAVTQILGRDKPGRVRGYGRGVTATKLASLHIRDAGIAEMQSENEDLKGMVRDLAAKKARCGDTEPSESGGGLKEGAEVQILDWIDSGEVIGVGEFMSADPMYKIDCIPIGLNAVAVYVKSALTSEAYIWRPITDVYTIEQAVGCKIAWPADKMILDKDQRSSLEISMQPNEAESRRCKIFDWINEDEVIAEGIMCSSDSKTLMNNIPLGPNAVTVEVVKVFNGDGHLWRPTADMFLISDAINKRIAWPVLKIELMNITTQDGTPIKAYQPKVVSPGSNNTSTSKNAKQKCILLDCNNTGRKVAEGRVISTDPDDKCHFVPLGPNASKVWVEVAKVGKAKVWRPNSEIAYISDAIGSVVAWPNDKISYV